MIALADTIATIKSHLAEGSSRALTYAALECRLAIERISYNRLARAHDYIAHEEIRRWQPHHVIKLLAEDVDPDVASTYTISVSRQPAGDVNYDPASLEYVPIGTQQGFDGAKLAKLWNALSNIALHVRLPKSSADQIAAFGDSAAIRTKVEETLVEIERIASGTLASTGIGQEVSFACVCGTHIKRRAALVPPGKIIFCINPDCAETWEAEHDGEDINFVRRKVEDECSCGALVIVPLAMLEKLRPSESLTARCACGRETIFHWRLFRRILPEGEALKSPAPEPGK